MTRRIFNMAPGRCSLALIAVAAIAHAAFAVEIIAHRGESSDAPENTLAAISLAWDRGADAVEFDVHLTQDGWPILIHDKDTKRTAGAKRVVAECTLAELRRLDAGAWKGARWAGERLPTLEEALARTPDKGRAFIEIKVGPEAVPAVAAAIGNSQKPSDQLAIISFNAKTVAEAKRRLPDIEAYYLADFKRDELTRRWSPSAETLIERAKKIGADGLDVSYKGPVDQAFVDKIHAAGLKIFVYTVDDPRIAQKLADFGVDGITTNRAAWLKSQIRLKSRARP